MKHSIIICSLLFATTFASAQNVGIGTTTPAYKLDVNGNLNIKGDSSIYVSGTRLLSINGVYNTFLGIGSGIVNTTGRWNSSLGYSSLHSNSTGIANVANGTWALTSNTTGTNNTANGAFALYTNTTGINNTANGMQALYYNSTGGWNTAIGMNALLSNTTGNNNTASGFWALTNTLIGGNNTANGYQALYASIGSNNTAVGYAAGINITSGSNNLALGSNTQVPSATGSNQIRLGDSSITYAGVQVAWSITSDRRWKSDIRKCNLGMDFISKLSPVSYYRSNDESKKREYGFIAQDLEQVLNSSGASGNGIISKDDNGMYGVRYNDLIAPMVKAIQELSAENNQLKILLSSQQTDIALLKLQMQKMQNQLSATTSTK